MALTQEQVLEALAAGPLRTGELAKKLGVDGKTVGNRLHHLRKNGQVRSAGFGGPWSLLRKGSIKTASRVAAHVLHASDDDFAHPPAIGANKDPLVDGLLERRAALVSKLKTIDEAIRALIE
jgi:hypothetical protein